MTTPRSSLTTLSLVGFLAWLSYEMVRSPVLPLFAKDLGISPAAIGFVVGASTITGIFLKFPAGVLSDLIPRRRLLLVGAVAFGLGPFGYLIIDDPGTLIPFRFLHGMATAVFAPVALAVIASRHTERRAESLSWYSSATMAGGLLGPVLGGILMQHAGFPITFLTAGIFGLAALGVVVGLRFPEPHVEQHPRGAAWREIRTRMARAAREGAGDPRILITSGMQGAQYMALGVLQAFLPLYGLAVGLDATRVGVLFGVQVLMTVLSKPMLGRLSDRIGRKPIILAGLGVSAAAIAGIPAAGTFGGLLGISAGFGLGVALVTSSVPALVADFCRERRYGSAMGLFGTLMDVGHASGPVLGGALIGRFGYSTAFVVAAAVLFLSALLFAAKVRT